IILFFFQAEDGIRDRNVTGVQTCALPISLIPIFLYYSWYLIEYLIRLCIYRNHDKAYHNIVFEREAFDLEKYWNKHDVLRKESKGFSFLKYYGKEYYHE